MGNDQNGQMVKRYGKPVVYMLTGGIEYLVERSGGMCKGISIRSTFGDSLLVIRADFEGVAMVAFVGGDTGAGAIVRAHSRLREGSVKWREDLYVGKG